MHQRELALRAWRKAGLKDRGRDFLRRLETDEEACWDVYVTLARNEDPREMRQLALPLWNTEDKVLRTNLLRALDWERPQERKFMQELIRTCDGEADEPELLAASEKGYAAAAYVFKAVKTLGPELSTIVDVRRKLKTA
jgi:hypothetical protein